MRSSFGTAISLASVASLVHAHGFFTTPSVEFRTPGEDPTAFVGTIDGPAVLPAPPGITYVNGPAESVKAFTAAFGNSSFKSLRDFVMKHETLEASAGISKQCGRTRRARQAQPLPDTLVWQNGPGEGLTPSHEGPCEVWCDDERVFQDDNCAKSHPEIPATLPYDKTKCQGKKLMQFVWLALHEVKWQVYTNCVPLVDGAFLNESLGSRDLEIRGGDVGSELTSSSSASHQTHNHSHAHRHAHIVFRVSGSTFAESSTNDADAATITVPLTPKPTPAPTTDGSTDDSVENSAPVRRALKMKTPQSQAQHADYVPTTQSPVKATAKNHLATLSKPGVAAGGYVRRRSKTLRPTHVALTAAPSPQPQQVPVHVHPGINQPDAAPAHGVHVVSSAKPAVHPSVKPAVHPGINQPDTAPAHGVHVVSSAKPAEHPSVKPAVHPGINQPDTAPAHGVHGMSSAKPAVHPGINQPDTAPAHGVHGMHHGGIPAHDGPLDTSLSKATAPPAPCNAPKNGFSSPQTPFITANKLTAANHLGARTSELNMRQLRSSVSEGHHNHHHRHHHHHHRHNDSSDDSASGDDEEVGKKKRMMKKVRKATWSFGNRFSALLKNIFK
ncbi:hypothetical protein PINS_up005801 [Pythium insidiosum]|nr:hypothetical protein PINS_up005801 [Pythium insidiosum]